MKGVKYFLFAMVLFLSFNLSAQTVFTTKTGEKYHKGNCGYLRSSKKEVTLERALELGYSACSVCKPPTVVGKTDNVSRLQNSSNLTTVTSNSKSQAVQCSGKTQSGTRCKRLTKASNGRCYQH